MHQQLWDPKETSQRPEGRAGVCLWTHSSVPVLTPPTFWLSGWQRTSATHLADLFLHLQDRAETPASGQLDEMLLTDTCGTCKAPLSPWHLGHDDATKVLSAVHIALGCVHLHSKHCLKWDTPVLLALFWGLAASSGVTESLGPILPLTYLPDSPALRESSE